MRSAVKWAECSNFKYWNTKTLMNIKASGNQPSAMFRSAERYSAILLGKEDKWKTPTVELK